MTILKQFADFECSECSKRFVSRAALNTHLKVHIVEEPAKCTICNKEFLRKDCLTRHMRSKHRWVAHAKCANCWRIRTANFRD